MKAFLQVKNKRVMRKFFARVVREIFPPGYTLKNIQIQDVGSMSFKKALKYVISIRGPKNKIIKKVIRGNVPSKDTRQESLIADQTKKILYQQGFPTEDFQIPFPLGYYKNLNLVLYEDFPGQPLSVFIGKKSQTKTMIKKSALALARLHKMKIKQGPLKKISEIKAEIGYFKEDYKNNWPEAYSLGSDILEKLFPLIEKQIFSEKEKFVLTHGDFNPNNIIIQKGKIGLIDWGRSYVYDPLSDVGNFLSQLNIFVWCHGVRPEKIEKIKKLFCRTYLRAMGLTEKKVARKLLIHELWWLLQIMAYSVSTWSPEIARQLVKGTLKIAGEYARQLGLEIEKDLTKSQNNRDLRNAFQDESAMLKFYSQSLHALFPEAKNVIKVKIKKRRAISQTSFLTKSELHLAWKNHQREVRLIRGNSIDRESYQLMDYIRKNNQKGLLSPRPLYFFPNIPYILYEEMPGRRLRDINFTSALFKKLVAGCATSLALLHAVKNPRLRSKKIEEKDFFQELIKKIGKYEKNSAPVFCAYVKEYQTKAKKRFKKARRALCHNDFQASNILVTPENKIALIDFTLSGSFFPSFDLANFLVHLRIMLEGRVSRKKIAALEGLFLNTYFRRAKKSLTYQTKKNLDLAKVRAALDIWIITVTLIGFKDPNRQKYVKILENIIKENLLCRK